ncbi:Signal peptidase i, partial [Thalictrum thalictroides]
MRIENRKWGFLLSISLVKEGNLLVTSSFSSILNFLIITNININGFHHLFLFLRQEEKEKEKDKKWIFLGRQGKAFSSTQVIRKFATQVINMGMLITTVLIVWKLWICVTGTESPVVVVLSGSMEPGFKRGEILFLHMNKSPISSGEIIVFNVE